MNSLTLRNCSNTAANECFHPGLFVACVNPKYIHMDAIALCLCINFRRMQQLKVLRLPCNELFPFEKTYRAPNLRCLEFRYTYKTFDEKILLDQLLSFTEHLQTLSLAFTEYQSNSDIREIFANAAKHLADLKNLKILIADEVLRHPCACYANLWNIFHSNPNIEWLVLNGVPLPWDFISQCLRHCANLKFQSVSFPGAFTLQQAQLVKSDLQFAMLNRIVNLDRPLAIFLPIFTNRLIKQSGIDNLFIERNDIKFGIDPKPVNLGIDQFVENEYYGNF